jgi:hypothetical protein
MMRLALMGVLAGGTVLAQTGVQVPRADGVLIDGRLVDTEWAARRANRRRTASR